MWEHYKKTFKSFQTAIALATVVIYFAVERRLVITAVFFLMMQLGSLAGAMWAERLRQKMLRS